MHWLFGVLGLLLMAFVLADFLFTTLSCNGSGKITSTGNTWIGRLLVPPNDKTRVWLGVFHLLFTLLTWVSLLLVGGFFVFASMDYFVVNSTTKEVASLPQRAYFTAFVFSTLGTGDFVPGSDSSRYFASVYSILGFGVLTTAITYILNVMSSANAKKNLAAYISSMGNTPLKLYDYFTTDDSADLFANRVDDLVEMVNTNINNHLCYPIVHFFISDLKPHELSMQLAGLHEATFAMRIRYADDPVTMAHLQRVDRVIARFLNLARTPDTFKREREKNLLQLRKQWKSRVPELAHTDEIDDKTKRQLGSVLRQFGFDWTDVYEDED